MASRLIPLPLLETPFFLAFLHQLERHLSDVGISATDLFAPSLPFQTVMLLVACDAESHQDTHSLQQHVMSACEHP